MGKQYRYRDSATGEYLTKEEFDKLDPATTTREEVEDDDDGDLVDA